MRISASVSACLLLLVFLLLTPLVQGQDCGEIKRQADLVEIRKKAAERRYAQLRKEFDTRQLIIKGLGAEAPELEEASGPQVNEAGKKYHNDRNYPACKASWGATDWGKVKDIREYHLDVKLMQNIYLNKEIENLNTIIAALQQKYGITPEAAPATDAPKVNARVSPLSPSRTLAAGKTYAYCMIDPIGADLRVQAFPGTKAAHGFQALEQVARKSGKSLTFAMNAGMYEANKKAVGLLVYRGKTISPLNARSGRGNFYMNPNGVFGLDAQGNASIWATAEFQRLKINPGKLLLATQSGPIMLRNGKINSLFTPGSDNLHFRNAVGVREDGQVIFAISEQKVNFYEFSVFLRDLGCQQALYLDGTVSRMYVPLLNKTQSLQDSQHLGPLIYLLE